MQMKRSQYNVVFEDSNEQEVLTNWQKTKACNEKKKSPKI